MKQSAETEIGERSAARKKFLVLVNPASNGGRGLRAWTRWAPFLPGAEAVILRSIGEAGERAAGARNVDAVVAVGGDGTISAVADGLLRNPSETLPLGVLYAGTSPDFCTFHQIPLEPSVALETLRSGGVEPVEVLKIAHNGKTAHFLCSCNLGIGADVAARANVLRPYLGDRFGTFCALLVSLLKHPRFDYTVNGESFPACGHMLITKMPYIAGGLALDLPHAADGEFLLWHTRARSFPGWMRLLAELYRKERCGELRRCSGTIRIESRTPCRVEYDGDPHGTLPVEISVAPRRLMLIKGGGQP